MGVARIVAYIIMTRLCKGKDVVVCLPGAWIEHVTERVEKIMGRGKGGTIMVHVGANNADKEGTAAIVDKYMNLLKKTKEAGVGQVILSGILPVFGNRIDGYRNSKRMAINWMMKRLFKCPRLYFNGNFLTNSHSDRTATSIHVRHDSHIFVE